MATDSSSDFDVGSGNFTVDFWFYTGSTVRQWFFAGSLTEDYHYALDYSTNGTSTVGTVGMWASSNGASWNMINADNGGNGIGSRTLSLNTWHHIAMVRNGNNWRTYIDGVKDIDINVSGTVVSSNALKIGRHGSSNSYDMNGYLEEFRFSKGIALWTSNFNPPTKQTGDESAFSMNSSNGSAYYLGNVGVGTTSPLAKFEVYGTAGNNAIANFASSSNASVFYIASSGFIGMGTTSPTAALEIVSSGGSTATLDGTLQNVVLRLKRYATEYGALYNITANNDLVLRASHATGSLAFQTGGSNERMRIDYSGNVGVGTTSPSAKFEVYGTAGNNAIANFASSSNTSALYIGANGNIGVGTTNPGAKFDVRGNIIGETDSYTKLLLHMDGTNGSTNFVDSETTPKTVGVSAVSISTAQAKFGPSSYLGTGGSSNYLTLASNTDWNYGTGAFTVEGWFYLNATGTDITFYSHGGSNVTEGTGGVVGLNSSNYMSYYAGGQRILGSTAATTGTWYHFALVGNGGTSGSRNIKLYLNGVQQGSTYTFDYNFAQTEIWFGSNQDSPTQSLNGYFDEIRISKGIARWTSNFLPPQRPYSSLSNEFFAEQDKLTTALTALNSGNVGIGTSTPGNVLTVVGSVDSTGTLGGYKMDGVMILYASTTNFSTLVGNGAGSAVLADGIRNTALGYQALNIATSSDNNTAIGYQTLFSNTTGAQNTAVGDRALTANTTGANNTANGFLSLTVNTTGSANNAYGRDALHFNTTGSNNNAYGVNALRNNIDGSQNIALGHNAGDNQTSGDNNIIIGGNSIDIASSTGSNQLNIGNLIYGINVDGTGTTHSTGNVGIGTTTPGSALTVVGNIYATGTITASNFSGTNTGDVTLAGNTVANGLTISGQALTLGLSSGSATGTLSATDWTTFNNKLSTTTAASTYVPYTGATTNLALGSHDITFTNATGTLFTTTGATRLGSVEGTISIGSAITSDVTNLFGPPNFFLARSNAFGDGMLNLALGNNSAVGGSFYGIKTRSTDTTADVVLNSGDTVADFAGYGAGGVNYHPLAGIKMQVDGTPGNNDMPGRIVFSTTPDGGSSLTEAMRITNAGRIGIGTTTPNGALTVVGGIDTTGSITANSGFNTLGTTGGYKIDNILILQASSTNQSTLIGQSAGAALKSDGMRNVAIGYEALKSATSSDDNLAVGYQALYSANVGGANVALGEAALYSDTAGYLNTALGHSTLYFNLSGNYNVASGYKALYNNSSGSNNVASGYGALENNSNASDNVAIGIWALNQNTSGTTNTGVGATALYHNQTGNFNTAVGNGAGGGASGQSHSNNSFFGHQAGYQITTGWSNTALGVQSGYANTTGTGNVYLGMQAGDNQTSGDYNIIIGGHSINLPSSTGSNQLNIGNLIYGTNVNGTADTLSTGNIGIGTTTPANKLSIYGAASIGATYENITAPTDGLIIKGNLGVGTSTPVAKLEVYGIAGNNAIANFASSSNASALYVAASRNIGIGTTTTNSLLTIEGAGQTSSWTTGTSLPGNRQGAASVVANGYVYVLGGYLSGATTTVLYAKLGANGNVGPWTLDPNRMPIAKYDGAAVSANGYLYQIGGYDADTNKVFYTKINSDGSTGAWITSSNLLPAAKVQNEAFYVNGYIYALGGGNTGVYYAKQNADGSVGVWQTGTAMPSAIADPGVVVANGYVYFTGGYSGGNAISTVYSAKINGDGSLGSWTTLNSLPAPRTTAPAISANGYIYVIGGYDSGTKSTVFYAPVLNDGTLGAWATSTNSLSFAVYEHTSVVSNGYIYTLAGGGESRIQYASLPRVSITGNLDLLGSASTSQADANSGESGGGSVGGSIMAGNIFSAGNLEVTGNSALWGGLGVNGNLSIYASSSATTSSIFSIQNATSTNPLMTVLYNGNVGLATTTPTARLEVYGAAGNNAIANFASSSNVSVLYIGPNGNVGISSSTPVAKLSVTQDMANQTSVTNPVASFVVTGTPVADKGSILDLYTPRGDGSGAEGVYMIRAQNSETAKFIVTGGGKVGIGTTTPQSALTIISANPPSPHYAGVNVLSNSSSAYTTIAVGRTVPEGYFGVSGQTDGLLTGTVAGDTAIVHTGKLHFGTNIAGGPSQITFDTSGNVGIGMTSPYSKLQVGGKLALHNGTAATPISFSATDGDPNTMIHKLSAEAAPHTGSLTTFASFVPGTADLLLLGHEGVSLGTKKTSDKLTLRVTSDGNVGIGTTTPATKLNIYGGTLRIDSPGTNEPGIKLYRVQSVTDNSYGGIEMSFADSANVFQLGPSDNGDYTMFRNLSSTAGYWFKTLNSSYNLVINDGGKIGIGTSSPASALDVYNPAGTSDVFGLSNSSNSRLFTVNYLGNVGIGNSAPSAKLEVTGTAGNNAIANFASSTNTSALYIAPSGNIGLGGNTSPSVLLHLGTGSPSEASGIQFGSTASDNISRDASYGGIKTDGNLRVAGSQTLLGSNEGTLHFYQPGNISLGRNISTGALEIKTLSALAMVVTDTQKVGIGTSTPSAKFEVYGTTTAAIANFASSSNTSALYIAASGNVGIGTTTPTNALTVIGDISATGTVKAAFNFLSPNAYIRGLSGFFSAINTDNAYALKDSVFAKVSSFTNPTVNLYNLGSIQTGTINSTAGGTFGTKTDYATPDYPYAVTVGDLNGDSRNDIVSAQYTGTNVTVFLNSTTTAGTFIAGVNYASPTTNSDVLVKDMNGDGKNDIIALSYGGGTFSVFWNQSTTTTGFSTSSFSRSDFSTGLGGGFHLAVGDFNKDGKLDVAVGNTGVASVFLNRGSRSFASPVTYAVSAGGQSGIAVGDFNGDGNNDIVTAGSPTPTISILIGNGDGTFGSETEYAGACDETSVAAGDLNGDGADDIVAGCSSGGSAQVFINKKDGTFATRVDYTFVNGYHIKMGDMNGDGYNDIVMTGTSNTISILMNNGDGTFAAQATYATPSTGSIGGSIGDLNGDGKLDVVSTAGSGSGNGSMSTFMNIPVNMLYTNALTGMVGIGTTTPLAKFEVYGKAGNNAIANFASSSNVSALYIGANGYVGIGTTTPDHVLTIQGTGASSTLMRLVGFGASTLMTDASGNVIAGTSDEKLKNLKGSFDRGLADIMGIETMNYNWKKESGLDTATVYAGFSAQNMKLVLPEAVGQNADGSLTLSDRPIIAALVNSVQQIGSVILKIQKGVIYFKNVATRSLSVGSKAKPAGITMYDENTGGAYCVKIKYGVLINENGPCQITVASSSKKILDFNASTTIAEEIDSSLITVSSTTDIIATTTITIATTTEATTTTTVTSTEQVATTTTQTEQVATTTATSTEQSSSSVSEVATSTATSTEVVATSTATTTDSIATTTPEEIATTTEGTIATSTEEVATTTATSISEIATSTEGIATTTSEEIATTTEATTTIEEIPSETSTSTGTTTASIYSQLLATVFNGNIPERLLLIIVLITQALMIVAFGTYVISNRKRIK